MNVLRCLVKISKVVQVDLPAETIGDQSAEKLAKLVARQQYGYDLNAEVLNVEAAYVETDGLCAACGGAKWTHSVRDHAWVAPIIPPAPQQAQGVAV